MDLGRGLSADRRKAVAALVPLLQRGLVNAGDADEFLSLYARAWAGRGISIGQRWGFGPWVTVRDLPESWIAVHTRLRHQDPSEAFLRNAPEGTPFTTSWMWNRVTRRTEIFAEFNAHDFADAMVQQFTAPGLGDIFSVTYRNKGARAFTRDDATLARALHTHVGGALATRSAMHALALPDALAPAAHAIVRFPRLEVQLDARSKRAWSGILGQPLGARGFARLHRMIARVALDFMRGIPGARSRRILPTVRAEAAWIPPERGESQRALVFFFDERRPELVLNAPAAELLSPTQRRVAELAARGLNQIEIARELALHAETVKTHLREAMRRLDVSRRTELVAFTEPAPVPDPSKPPPIRG